MMRKPGYSALGVVSLLCALFLAACSGSPKPQPVTLSSITVAPSSAPVNVGQTKQFTATGHYSDGTTTDLTTNSSLTWASSKTSVGTITSGGLATAVAAGTSNITASMGGITSSPAVLSVSGIQSITVTPAFATIILPGTQQYVAKAIIINPDGTLSAPQDISATATWASSSTGFATINSSGLATGVATGLTQITASSEGVTSNIAYLTVGNPPPTVVGLNLTPMTAALAAGQTLQYAATEVWSDGSTQPVSAASVAWTISCTPTGGVSIGLATGLAITKTSAAGASCTVTGTLPLNGVPSSVSGTATITVTAAVARFAYVGNAAGSISEYAANPAGGALIFLGKFPAVAPQQVLVHPSGNYLYSIGGNGFVYVYDVNPTTGAIVANMSLPGAPYQVGSGNGNDKGVIDPTGRFLYVVDSLANTVSGFTITQSTGALSALAPLAVGQAPTDVLVDHTGAYLYVINQTDADITGFTITAGTGVLVPNTPAVAAPPYTVGSLGSPSFGTIDPTNAYLYVPDGASNVDGFDIAPTTGLLTAFTTAIPPITGAQALFNLAIDPGDKYIFVLDATSTGDGDVYAFNVGTGGAFGAAIGAGPTLAGSGPDGIAVDPSSMLLAVDNNFSNTISLFQIGATGALTTLTPASTDSSPLFVTYYNGTAAASVTPAEVVTADKTTGMISAFTAAAGVLTADPNAPYTGVAGNSQIGTSVTGSLFFAGGSAAAKPLAAFSFNAANNPAIAALSGSPFSLTPAGAAGTVIADPTGLFVYVADTTNGQADSYAYNATTNSLVASGASATGLTGLQALVSHPQGSVIYALASNGTITPIVVYSGIFTAGTPEAFAGNWTVGAVDGSGQYLFAVDGTGLKLHFFAITPVGAGGTDGGLLEIGTGTSIPGAVQPAGVVVDPTDRFVLVTDAGTNGITPFTFNPALGTLTAGTAQGGVSGGAGQVTVDPTGTYVFAALPGVSSGIPPSGVAVFTVNVSGSTVTLTPVTGSPFLTPTRASGTTGVGVINSVQ
jgi:6-phosphogluconolactonase (cycloisomerase 2 family)